MSKYKSKEFENLVEDLREQKLAAAETVKAKQVMIEKEADTIHTLKRFQGRYEYLDKLYTNVPSTTVNSMSATDFKAFTSPLVSTLASGEVVFDLYDEARAAADKSQEHFSLVSSVDNSASTAVSWVADLTEKEAPWFPMGWAITNEYKVEDEVYTQIGEIRFLLGGMFPDIQDEFDAFVRKFDAFKSDDTKYQDLIGSRSMFFFKMIFDFCEKTFKIRFSRRNAIRKFVFGNGRPIPAAEPFIDACFKIWKEFSSQDPSGLSIKYGSTTPIYVDGLFRRLVDSMANILRLRGSHFTM